MNSVEIGGTLVSSYVISGIFFFVLFVLFLIFGKTLNSIINQLTKIEYILNKEKEFYEEELEIRKFLLMKRNRNLFEE